MTTIKTMTRTRINPEAEFDFMIPNLMEVQLDSFNEFLQADKAPNGRARRGLQEAFMDIFPIKDYTGNLIMEFIEYTLGLDMCKGCPGLDMTPKQDCLFEDCSYEERECAFIEYGNRSYRIKYEPTACQKRDLTFSIPLNIRVRLINKLSGEVKEQELFVVNLPLMTQRGTFIINGAERVIVSQLHRSPGVYFDYQAKGTSKLFTTKVVPYRGAWLEYELDVMKDIVYVRLDRKRKIPVTTFLRSLGYEDDDTILSLFDDSEIIQKTLKVDKATNAIEALDQIYRKLRPGEPFIEENARSLIEGLFFNHNRYDLGDVGRYKLNQKLSIFERVVGQIAAETIIDQRTGEIICETGKRIHPRQAILIHEAEVVGVHIRTIDDLEIIVRREFETFLAKLADYDDERRAGLEGYVVAEAVMDPSTGDVLLPVDHVLTETSLYRITEAKVEEMHLRKGRVLEVSDIVGVIRYLINLSYGVGQVDDIDHLGNRRVRTCGELLQNQFRVSLARMERVIRERMTIQDINSLTPQVLINTRPIVGVIDEFFGSSQLSQFMDQVNPLAELTHKRRLSALGPGGLRRERAGYEVRDVHPTHFGRVCPIETPEGPNAGLIGSLAVCSRLDPYGFIMSPFRSVIDGQVKNDPHYMDAIKEEKFNVSPYDTNIVSGAFPLDKMVPAKMFLDGRQEFSYSTVESLDKIHVSPLQMISVAASLIPFLEHDDANRALMGTNMQRQAVPLLQSEAPIVGTGVESFAARDSGVVILAKHGGVVTYVDATRICIKRDLPITKTLTPATYSACLGYTLIDDVANSTTGKMIAKAGTIVDRAMMQTMLDGYSGNLKVTREASDEYQLIKFARTNQNTCNNQRPIVSLGQRVDSGQPIADGASTDGGELALGKNVVVAFMPFNGYNFEDAIVMSERMVKDDTFTSIHISAFEVDARDTKLGPEEITRDIPSVGEEVLANLDENGIIRIGAEVQPGDILVGKITPKGETELTAEDKLLRAIFGEKAREVRNTSLAVPHGEKGKVVDVMMFSRETGDELPYGVNKLVRVFVAQRRQISEGDKVAGRHGNKGVISKIVPEYDMPFLENGTPVDIVLNPLGVPSRMNLGQVLETHLGWAGMVKGVRYATSVFNKGRLDDGSKVVSNEDFVKDELESVGLPRLGRVKLLDGQTGVPFDQEVMVGNVYLLKLAHLVDDKIHARATGPYSLVTQQPLGGKAQFGGQRFGEMEVWALEAYGAAHTLRELLTIKSDDVEGRVTVYETIIKGDNMMKPSVPESFKVVVCELQSLGLKVELFTEEGLL